jgi:hypothetical protein
MDRKFLEDMGLEKATIDAILNQNGAEVATLNTRLKTAEVEASTLRNDLTTARGRVAELEKVDVQTLQTELENEKAARKADKREWALLAALNSAGCTDTDYIRYKLGDSVEYTDEDALKDPENAVKEWAEKFPTFFKKAEEDGKETETKPNGTGSTGNFATHRGKTPAKNNPYTLEGWNLTEQMRLELEDKARAEKLKAEALN